MRLIGVNGEQVGIVPTLQAISLAEENELDLVEISPNADPPVCRIMNYGKYLFQQQKDSGKKKRKTTQIKEIKFRPGIEEQDYQVKLRNLIKFLKAGNKVKITLRYRGREMAHQELGQKLLDRLVKDLIDYGVIEQMPKLEGRQVVAVLAPKRAS